MSRSPTFVFALLELLLLLAPLSPRPLYVPSHSPTMWGPLVINWFITPSNYSYTIVLSTINHSEIGVMFTNLAIVWGPHIVCSWSDFRGNSSVTWMMQTKSSLQGRAGDDWDYFFGAWPGRKDVVALRGTRPGNHYNNLPTWNLPFLVDLQLENGDLSIYLCKCVPEGNMLKIDPDLRNFETWEPGSICLRVCGSPVRFSIAVEPGRRIGSSSTHRSDRSSEV